MTTFNQDWFDNKLITGGSLSMLSTDFSRIAKSVDHLRDRNIDIVINVDSNFDHFIDNELRKLKIKNYWFPMNEFYGDIGINSIYAAMTILFHAEKTNKKVYLHCAVGANRSPTVKACYHFMRTGLHTEDELIQCDPNIQKMFIDHEYQETFVDRNKLLKTLMTIFYLKRLKYFYDN